MRLVHILVEPEANGDLLIGGIVQHGLATTDHHRNIRNRNMELVEQCLHIAIAIQIDVRVRVAVARQEFLNAKCVSRVVRADQRNVPKALREQLCAPENESAHQDLAQLSIGLYKSEHVFTADFDDFARLTRPNPIQGTTAREGVDLAGELPRWDSRDRRLVSTGWTHCLQFSGNHNEDRYVFVPLFDEDLSGADRTSTTVCCDAVNLRRSQRRKDLINVRSRQR